MNTEAPTPNRYPIEDPDTARAVAYASYPENTVLWMHRRGGITLHPSDVANMEKTAKANEEEKEAEYSTTGELHSEPSKITAKLGEVAIDRQRPVFPEGVSTEQDEVSLDAPDHLSSIVTSIQSAPRVRDLLDAINSRVPLVSETPRGPFSKKEVDWSYVDQTKPGKPIAISFSLEYDAVDGGNTPTKLKATIRDGHKKDEFRAFGASKGIEEEVRISDAGILSIKVNYDKASWIQKRDLLEPKAAFIEAQTNTSGIDMSNLAIDISLDMGSLGVTIERKYEAGKGRKLTDTYTYDPDKNEFIGVRNESETLPSKTPKAFQAFVEKMLALIPLERPASL